MQRLLPMSDRAKDAEILARRHQITILARQLHGDKVRFTPADRAPLAALLHPFPQDMLRQVRLLVRPETVLRWHHDVIATRHAHLSRPRRAGRPPTTRSIAPLRWLIPVTTRLLGEGFLPPSTSGAAAVCVRGFPASGRGDHGRGALVSALRAVYRDVEELLAAVSRLTTSLNLPQFRGGMHYEE